MSYRPEEFEKKWRDYWEEKHIYRVELDESKPKFYCLDMFPYPSGKGLHVGHPLGYIASDIYSRYKRMQGYNVLHPMGFDAFGLPAEQYAIQTDVHPADSTQANARRYREQLKQLGLSYDWSREVKTCDPFYYRWTQWIFSQMYQHYYDTEKGKALPIPELIAQFETKGTEDLHAAGTEVLEFQSADWKAWSKAEKASILMNYRLAYRSESYVNWCEELGTVLANDEVKDGVSERGGFPVVKKPMMQWSLRTTAYAERLLGGLEGLEWSDALKLMQQNWIGKSRGALIHFPIKGMDRQVSVFTTRPDTIFGVSFMVLAPEHDLIQEITTLEQKELVEAYIRYVSSRSERERMSEMQDMSGAFTGAFVLHPLTGQDIPIYISEYVLKDYGTGAIMAVPDGDDRDRRFAEKFDLPIPIIQEEKQDDIYIINSEFLDGLTGDKAVDRAIEVISKKGFGEAQVNFKLRDANFSRQRYWGEPFPIYYDEDDIPQLVEDSQLPVRLPGTDDFKPSPEGESPLSKVKEWVITDRGRRETDTMPGFAGSSWYYFRYMDPHNSSAFAGEDALQYWKDVDLYIGGAEHAVGHLLYARMWCKFLYDIGLSPVDEPFKKLVNQGMIQGRSSFVYRANEKFAEAFIKKLLKDNLSSYESDVLIEGANGKTFSADFACRYSKVVIELKAMSDLERYFEEHRKDFEAAGYIFLPISTEELFYNYHTPEVIINKIESATKSASLVTYCCNTGLFISRDMVDDRSHVSELHVDISMVSEKDKLDLKAFEASRVDLDKIVYLTNAHGEYLCGHQVEKMSKSKFNVINPDDVVEQYGTDCFRLYEMFLGPLDQAKPWDTQNIGGVSKFLRKFYYLYWSEDGDSLLTKDQPTKEEFKVLHQCIKKVHEDIERMGFNTCISAMMIAVNDLKKLNCNKRDILEPLVCLIAPFAPHMAEELWKGALGHSNSVVTQAFPDWAEKYLVEDEINYPLCINGKKRAEASFSKEMSREELIEKAINHKDLQKWLDGKNVVKTIVVPNKMINVVVK